MKMFWLVAGLLGVSGSLVQAKTIPCGACNGAPMTMGQPVARAAADVERYSSGALFFAPVPRVDAGAGVEPVPAKEASVAVATSGGTPGTSAVGFGGPSLAGGVSMRHAEDLSEGIPTFLSLLLMGTGLCGGAGVCIYLASLLARRAEGLVSA